MDKHALQNKIDLFNIVEKRVCDCKESDMLAVDVFNAAGCKLLSVNTVITEYIKAHLLSNSIKTICVYKTAKSTERSKFHLNIIKSYGDTVTSVKKIITNLVAGEPIHYNEIIKVSEKLIKSMDIRRSVYLVKYTSQLRSADQYTYTHSVNVALYSMLIAKWMGLPDKDIMMAAQSGLLHDLGKTKIPPNILNKNGSLTRNEFTVMKSHPLQSYKLLYSSSEIDSQIKEAALLHHERLDGSGYPLGTTSISTLGRIVSIADVYDAMTSDRVYKKGVTPFKAFEYFQNEGLGLFDLHVTKVFITSISALLIGSTVKMTSGETAKVVFIPLDRPTNPVLKIDSSFRSLDEIAGNDIAQMIMEA